MHLVGGIYARVLTKHNHFLSVTQGQPAEFHFEHMGVRNDA